MPIELIDLGTSAGLNLRCDHFCLDLANGRIGPEHSSVSLAPDWTGPWPGTRLPKILSRKGVDLNPLDPRSSNDQLRLLAYLWPDQPERIARTQAAIEIANSVPATIDAGDAGAWVEAALAEPAADCVRVIFHTVAWQYFPEQTNARALAAMKDASAPLVQISMEADGGQGAAITMTTWPDGTARQLGRASFHGIWVNWTG